MKITEWFLKKIRKKEIEQEEQEVQMEETVLQEEESVVPQETVTFKKQKVDMDNSEERNQYVRNCCEHQKVGFTKSNSY